MQAPYPPIDESLDRLYRSGWSVGHVGTAATWGPVPLLCPLAPVPLACEKPIVRRSAVCTLRRAGQKKRTTPHRISAMRTCVTWVVVLSLLGCGQAARAEPPLARVDLNSGPGGGFGNLYLLGQRAVQQDLRLSQGQVEKVRGLLREVVDKQQAWRGEKDPEERRQLAGEAVRVRLRNDGLAAALLTSGQAERLKQISWQYRATASFWDPEVRDALRITDEQLARIKAIGMKDYPAWNREATHTLFDGLEEAWDHLEVDRFQTLEEGTGRATGSSR